MQRWRYKAVMIRDLALSEAKLNTEGDKGWELVSVCMADATTARAFFKMHDDGSEPLHTHTDEMHHAVASI